MRITFVTESHAWGDEKRSVDVVGKDDIDRIDRRVDGFSSRADGLDERVDELDEQIDDGGKQMKALVKRLTAVEKALENIDVRLRNDSRSIFADVIRESMLPVFAALGLAAEERGLEVPKTTDGKRSVKKAAKPRKASVKDAKAKKSSAVVAKATKAVRPQRAAKRSRKKGK